MPVEQIKHVLVIVDVDVLQKLCDSLGTLIGTQLDLCVSSRVHINVAVDAVLEKLFKLGVRGGILFLKIEKFVVTLYLFCSFSFFVFVFVVIPDKGIFFAIHTPARVSGRLNFFFVELPDRMNWES